MSAGSPGLPPVETGPAARPYLSVVAPCYNEEQSVPEFHRRVSGVCRQITDSHEIVLVDDGSHDRTWAILQELAAADPHVIAVKLSRNHGHQLALTAGLHVCRGEHILIIDADLQDPPELLPQMLERAAQGVDVVYGQRRERVAESRFKLWTAAAFYRIINALSDTTIPVDTGDFRLMSRRALDALLAMPERSRFLRGMVTWIGFRQEPLVFDRAARYAGETKWPVRKMVRFATDALIAFSMWPVKLAGLLALGAGGLAILLLIIGCIGAFAHLATAGWFGLVGIIALFASFQLFVLWILGEYLGRLYDQAKGRPLFIIETVERRT
jgi:polyisoprenyl-phosphate glycosyltransferase